MNQRSHPSSPGQRIRERRKALNMKQVTLAAKLRVSQPAVSQWEHDACRPSSALQYTLADILRCSRAWLFEADEVAA